MLNIFWKKMTLLADVFLNFRLWEAWLDKCLRSPVSEDSATSNIVNGLKYCWKLNDSTFTIFIDTCAGTSGSKSISEWCAKSQDCLLTRSLPIISILLLREAIYCNIFRSNYLRKEKHFIPFFFFFFFFLHFLNLDSILNFFKQRRSSWLMYFSTYALRKT